MTYDCQKMEKLVYASEAAYHGACEAAETLALVHELAPSQGAVHALRSICIRRPGQQMAQIALVACTAERGLDGPQPAGLQMRLQVREQHQVPKTIDLHKASERVQVILDV